MNKNQDVVMKEMDWEEKKIISELPLTTKTTSKTTSKTTEQPLRKKDFPTNLYFCLPKSLVLHVAGQLDGHIMQTYLNKVDRAF